MNSTAPTACRSEQFWRCNSFLFNCLQLVCGPWFRCWYRANLGQIWGVSERSRARPLVVFKEVAGDPVELACRRPLAPPADHGEVTAGRIAAPAADHGKEAAGRITRRLPADEVAAPAADHGGVAAGRVDISPAGPGDHPAGRVDAPAANGGGVVAGRVTCPPLTAAAKPLAVLNCPPLTTAKSPQISLLKPTTNPPKREKLCSSPTTTLCEPVRMLSPSTCGSL
jgi:hypothetical protein